jgi:hypothetical protein
MSNNQKNDSAMNWIIQSLGFVDKVCCASYAGQQEYGVDDDSTIQVTNRSGAVHMSWFADEVIDTEVLCDTTHATKAANGPCHYDISAIAEEDDQFERRYQYREERGKILSSGRSVSTRSTATTSTTTTVLTGCRTRTDSTDQSIASIVTPTTNMKSSRQIPQQIHARQPRHSSFRKGKEVTTRPSPDKVFLQSHLDGEVFDSLPLKTVDSGSFVSVPLSGATEGYPCNHK